MGGKGGGFALGGGLEFVVSGSVGRVQSGIAEEGAWGLNWGFLVETSNGSNGWRRWAGFLWPVAMMATIIWASGTGGAEVPSGMRFPHLDKVAHFLIFGLIGTLIYRVVFTRPGKWRAFWFAVGLTSLFGVLDETRQSFNPNRSVEIADWLADTSGALLAIGLYRFWPFYRNLLETRVVLFKRKRNGAERSGGENRGAAAGNRPA